MSDLGRRIFCRVTATNPYGSASACSNVVGPVVAGGLAPINLVAPVAGGIIATDEILSCTTGTWDGDAPITYTYQWYVIPAAASNLLLVAGGELLLHDGVSRLLLAGSGSGGAATAIPGATSATYVVPAGSEGNSFYCRVTATNASGSAAANSNILPSEDDMPPPSTPITDLHRIGPALGAVPATNEGTLTLRQQIWLGWTPVPGSKGTVIYRSRNTGTTGGTPTRYFTNWEAARVGYPGNTFRDGAQGPLDSGRDYTYQAAAYYDNGEGPLSTPAVTTHPYLTWNNGYQALLIASPASNIAQQGFLSDYTAVYEPLAAAPTNWEGNNIYYFISTQNIYFNVPAGTAVEICQPVVAYGAWGDVNNPTMGGNYWWLANWMITGGRYWVGPAMALPGGVTKLTGKITRTGPFAYTSSFVEYPALDLSHSGFVQEMRHPIAAYEYYSGSDGIPDWTYQPGDMIFKVTNVSLSILGAGLPVLFSYTRAPLSGTTRNDSGNGTATPTVIFHPQQNNDWFPVNM